MKQKILSKWLSLFGIMGIYFSLITVLFFVLDSSIHSSYANSADLIPGSLIDGKAVFTSTQSQADSGLPVRLMIPKIKVNAVIESVGLTPGGAVDVPKGPAKTAWYKLGPRPGDSGSAVITGHYGRWKNGSGSVFDNLYKLKKGDKIYVKDEKGTSIAFVVREIRKYDPKADAYEVFVSKDDKAHLNLITCDGVWNRFSKNYSRRLVVFTDRE
jgi:LPXTG-site transpeptidase (sortase) family protein